MEEWEAMTIEMTDVLILIVMCFVLGVFFLSL